MENEKLTYINSRGERLELGVDSVYHCNISKDVEGISGVTSVIYSTNSMGQHGDTYVGQRIEARDIDVVGHINTRDKAQALELRRRMLKIFNPELSATLVYEYGGFKRVIDCRAYGEPKILKKEVLYEFDLQIGYSKLGGCVAFPLRYRKGQHKEHDIRIPSGKRNSGLLQRGRRINRNEDKVYSTGDSFKPDTA